MDFEKREQNPGTVELQRFRQPETALGGNDGLAQRQEVADGGSGVRRLTQLQALFDTGASAPRPAAQAKGAGRGLPTGLKNGIEATSQLAMDDVRVHYDSPEPAQLQAAAFARGSEIHLGPGNEGHLPPLQMARKRKRRNKDIYYPSKKVDKLNYRYYSTLDRYTPFDRKADALKHGRTLKIAKRKREFYGRRPTLYSIMNTKLSSKKWIKNQGPHTAAYLIIHAALMAAKTWPDLETMFDQDVLEPQQFIKQIDAEIPKTPKPHARRKQALRAIKYYKFHFIRLKKELQDRKDIHQAKFHMESCMNVEPYATFAYKSGFASSSNTKGSGEAYGLDYNERLVAKRARFASMQNYQDYINDREILYERTLAKLKPIMR